MKIDSSRKQAAFLFGLAVLLVIGFVWTGTGVFTVRVFVTESAPLALKDTSSPLVILSVLFLGVFVVGFLAFGLLLLICSVWAAVSVVRGKSLRRQRRLMLAASIVMVGLFIAAAVFAAFNLPARIVETLEHEQSLRGSRVDPTLQSHASC